MARKKKKTSREKFLDKMALEILTTLKDRVEKCKFKKKFDKKDWFKAINLLRKHINNFADNIKGRYMGFDDIPTLEMLSFKIYKESIEPAMYLTIKDLKAEYESEPENESEN